MSSQIKKKNSNSLIYLKKGTLLRHSEPEKENTSPKRPQVRVRLGR